MWYVFLWLSICGLTALCQRIDNFYRSNNINSLLYPRTDYSQQPSDTDFINKLRRDRYFENQYNYFRNPFDPYLKRLKYISPGYPSFFQDRMVDSYQCSNNYLGDLRRNEKRSSRQFYVYPRHSYDHYSQYPNFLINWKPYPRFNNPPPINPNREWDKLSEKGIYNNNILPYQKEDAMSKLNSDDITHPLEVDLTINANEAYNRCTNASTVKTEKQLILPSDIIIKNIGPWVSKSDKKVLSKNVGSLSMIYNPDDSFVEIVSSSSTCPTEGLTDICRKLQKSMSSLFRKVQKISPDVDQRAQSPVECISDLCRNASTGYTDDSNSSYESTSNDLSSITETFDEETATTSEDDELSHKHSSTEQYSNPHQIILEYDDEVVPKSSTETTEELASMCQYVHDDSDVIVSTVTYDISDETTDAGEEKAPEVYMKKFKHKNFELSSSNPLTDGSHEERGLTKKTKLNGNRITYNKPSCCFRKHQDEHYTTDDEPVTFKIEDYVCECRHQAETTTDSSFLKKILSLERGLRRFTHNRPPYYKGEETDYLEGDELSHQRFPNVWDGLNETITRPKWEKQCENGENSDTARTKRNIKSLFRIHHKRKRKREFVSSEDSDSVPLQHKKTKRKGLRRRHMITSIVPNIQHNKQRQPPNHRSYNFNQKVESKTSRKREFVSFEGYSNNSCVEESETVPPTNNTKSPPRNLTTKSASVSTVSHTSLSTVKKEIVRSVSTYGITEAEERTTPYALHLVPDTGNRHPAKLNCEQTYQVECICNTDSVVEDLNNIVARDNDIRVLLRDLTAYNCSDYRPLNVSYNIASDLKPRLITKKQKELIVDEEYGPKEITPETFQDMLWRGIPNEGMDFYIFPSTSVQVPCFIHNDIQLSPNLADSTKYDWRHGNKKPITEGRVIEDVNHKGMLQIKDATVVDSDNYTCTVTYVNPDSGENLHNTFVHSVLVVELPKLALHTLLHYTAQAKCDQETLEMFELYLPQQIEELICSTEQMTTKVCSVEIHNPLCHSKDIKVMKEGPRSIWESRSRWYRQMGDTSENVEDNKMEMSLNYELDMADIGQVITAAVNRTHCNPFCQLKILLKMIEVLRDSLVVSLSNSVKSSMGVTFEPDLTTLNMKMLIACEGGLKLFQGFCIPCPLHTYSREGSTECTPCPKWTYQPNVGSKGCENCPHPFEPGCSSLWSSPKVIVILSLLVFLILLVAGLILYFLKRIFGHRKESQNYIDGSSNSITKRDSSKRNDSKKKKKRKLSRRYIEDSSDAPTLPSEDFTG